ncbi:unnamed protein product [Ambrosiozyma monospora]|uniref:Unnamed protein product n=2 Tax=Ambrosiozyma monospora TaxID=43982 RepID=A0A9W6Z2R0_AMBMO|nr:unnamed protein product [Ambrosiozyma monospora]
MAEPLIPSETLTSFHNFITSSNCKTILALLGAGLSSASGLPTFRGSGGYWRHYNSIDLATPDAFERDPGLVWQFYSYRRHMALAAKPNAGHQALAQLSHNDKINFLTITQNVDGLSQRANHNSQKLIELHGSLFCLKCTNFTCSYRDPANFNDPLTESLDASSLVHDKDNLEDLPFLSDDKLPHCPLCETGLLRPGVVWFGESLSWVNVDKTDEFMMRNHVDLMLVIGTSGLVWPAASYIDIVKNQGGKVAVFNIEKDDTDTESWQFIGDCSKTLPMALKPLIDQVNLSSEL